MLWQPGYTPTHPAIGCLLRSSRGCTSTKISYDAKRMAIIGACMKNARIISWVRMNVECCFSTSRHPETEPCRWTAFAMSASRRAHEVPVRSCSGTRAMPCMQSFYNLLIMHMSTPVLTWPACGSRENPDHPARHWHLHPSCMSPENLNHPF